MKISLLLLVTLLAATTSLSAYAASNVSANDTQQVKPKMHVVDRDWEYFKAISCSLINDVKFHSRSEEILVAKRKSQCVNKYEAFLPRPIEQWR